MTDKKLLELAAKAYGVWVEERQTIPFKWNPLTDDGDALRLAVKLNIDIEVFRDKTSTWVVIGCGYFETEEDHKDDPYAATRRAIVRAAAEIGKTL